MIENWRASLFQEASLWVGPGLGVVACRHLPNRKDVTSHKSFVFFFEPLKYHGKRNTLEYRIFSRTTKTKLFTLTGWFVAFHSCSLARMGLLLLALDFADLEIPLIPHGLHRPGLTEKKSSPKKKVQIDFGGPLWGFCCPGIWKKTPRLFRKVHISLVEFFRIKIRMGLAFTMTFGGFTSKKLGKFDPNLGHFIHGVFRTKNTLTRLDAFFAIFPANFCKSWLMVLFCGRFRMFQKWCVFSFFEFGDDFEKGDHIMLVPRKEVCHFFQPREKVHHTQLPNGYLVTFFPSWKWNRKMILPWEMIWHFESMDFLCLSQINHNPYDPCDWYMYLYIYHWRKVDHVMWVNIPVPWILWVIILFLFLRPTFTWPTPWKLNIASENQPSRKERIIVQPSFCRGDLFNFFF